MITILQYILSFLIRYNTFFSSISHQDTNKIKSKFCFGSSSAFTVTNKKNQCYMVIFDKEIWVILNRKLATRRVFLLATIDFKWTNNKSKHISVVFLVRVSLWNRGPFCKYQYWPTTLAQCQAKGIDCPWDLMLANQHIVCGLNGSGTIQPWHRKKVCKTMCVSRWEAGKNYLGKIYLKLR